MIPYKIIALIPRLATSFDGELVATRDAIARLLKAAELDWNDLAAACTPAFAKRSACAPPPKPAGSFGDLARAARDLDRGRLTPRERCFVLEMCAKGFAFRPSQRQVQWLSDILARLRERSAA